MIERYQLRYFLAVVESGTFSRAARQVNVTQPTLSNGIAKLEKTIGGALFVRNSRRVHLTPLGAALIDQDREIERGFNALSAGPDARAPRPVLRLGMLSTIPTSTIEAMVRANAAQDRPDVLEIVEGTDTDRRSRLSR